jgi:RNA polymerase sigma-70 factor (ECF subfamily)
VGPGRRRSSLLDRLGPDVDHGDAMDDSDAAVDVSRRWAGVAAALDRMDDDSREVLLLVAWDQLTYEEIAGVLDVPIGTVRSRDLPCPGSPEPPRR